MGGGQNFIKIWDMYVKINNYWTILNVSLFEIYEVKKGGKTILKVYTEVRVVEIFGLFRIYFGRHFHRWIFREKPEFWEIYVSRRACLRGMERGAGESRTWPHSCLFAVRTLEVALLLRTSHAHQRSSLYRSSINLAWLIAHTELASRRSSRIFPKNPAEPSNYLRRWRTRYVIPKEKGDTAL